MDSAKTSKWYTQNWATILFLILFFPVGLFLMWKYSKWSNKVKVVITTLIGIFVLIGSLNEPNKQAISSDTAPSPIKKSQIKNDEVDISGMTDKEKIDYLVNKKLKGKNTLDLIKLRNVEIDEQANGLNVLVEFNADDNLTASLRKTGITSDMSSIYMELFNNVDSISGVQIVGYFPLQDKYGNVSSEIVLETSLDKTEYKKINLDQDDAYLRLTIIPNVWTVIEAHPEFR